MDKTNQYLSDFERLERQPASPALQRLRKAAIARFAEMGFPGPRDEEWKFTPLASLVQTPFQLPPSHEARAVEGFRKIAHGDKPGATLGRFNANHPFLLQGSRPLPAGVLVLSLAEAL